MTAATAPARDWTPLRPLASPLWAPAPSVSVADTATRLLEVLRSRSPLRPAIEEDKFYEYWGVDEDEILDAVAVLRERGHEVVQFVEEMDPPDSRGPQWSRIRKLRLGPDEPRDPIAAIDPCRHLEHFAGLFHALAGKIGEPVALSALRPIGPDCEARTMAALTHCGFDFDADGRLTLRGQSDPEAIREELDTCNRALFALAVGGSTDPALVHETSPTRDTFERLFEALRIYGLEVHSGARPDSPLEVTNCWRAGDTPE